ncbi:Secreted protein containing C-terminal beta-propeller domain [Peptoclostridium litorale DSM 5388]|uniref:Secreted protein n=1 Tax=Peptoclostridium litorale DSM 5388 TaxID=1121324 RepID=A0A069RE73_PEPLI|nr:beta-propeller domain-containing protein [Peptoclostridium litorale]KDR93904.1 secreted protein [Peptoclostridium litorale DSM 5388]KDR95331.1 secreted protein [Peptoclostridium litorale DSM 5388]SIN88260.1 Secreted protein containing C-terminal beta-propeller domain [Peptoclostridium litorale DSM 5388]
MRKMLCFIIVAVMGFQMGLVSYAQGITVEIDKNAVKFDVEPVIEDGRVLVPFRRVFEELGLSVEWDGSLDIASAYDEGTSLSIKASSRYGSVNGELLELETAAKIVDGRMLVPLRFISEAFGNEVVWDGDKRLVSITSGFKEISKTDELPAVGSREKLMAILEYSQRLSRFYTQFRDDISIEKGLEESFEPEAGDTEPPDYSETNIQVEGVDEADIVKTDGEYIYQIRNNNISVVRADGGKLSLESEIEGKDGFKASEMYLSGETLAVIGVSSRPEFRMMDQDVKESIWPYPGSALKMEVYDISDKSSPKQVRSVEIDGRYVTSRLIEGKLYMVANKNMNVLYREGEFDYRPSIYDSIEGRPIEIPYDEIRYFPDSVMSSYLITIGIDLENLDKRADIDAYLGSGQNVYASRENMYVAETRYEYDYELDESGNSEVYYPVYKVNTDIFKFRLDGGDIDYVTKGKVAGTVLNQFSMDEHGGEFRIATTSGEIWRTDERTSKNNIYVLDRSMDVIGKLEGIAPTEKIYSARFIGDRAYMVTFRQVDPFYVIDLSDSENPEILGYLKIPGYSDYLHPYDESHIIGFGKETVQTKGGFTVEGMKIGIFDVSDVESPVQSHAISIGERGTDSEMLRNHKALMFSSQKGIMAFPLTEMRKADEGWSQFYYQGAYVYAVDVEKGFDLIGKASHLSREDYEKAGSYWYESDKNVKRIIYIGDNIYTISSSAIHSHDMNDMSFEGKIEFEK